MDDGDRIEVKLTGYAPGSMTIRVDGDIIDATADDLRQEFGRLLRPDRDVILDLSGVCTVTDDGIRVIEWAQRRLATAGRSLTIQDSTDPARSALAAAGIATSSVAAAEDRQAQDTEGDPAQSPVSDASH